VNVNNDNLITSLDYTIQLAAASTASSTVAATDIDFVVTGGSAADTITTGSGADTVDGGGAADTIVTGAGADNITGGAGADTITAGSGDDTIALGSDSAADKVVMAATNALNGIDTISGFEVGGGGDLLDFTAATASGYSEVTAAPTLDTSAVGMLVLDYDVATAAASMTAAQLYTAASGGGDTGGNAGETVYVATTTDATNAASVFVFKATMNATSDGFSAIDHMVTLTGITDLTAAVTGNFDVS